MRSCAERMSSRLLQRLQGSLYRSAATVAVNACCLDALCLWQALDALKEGESVYKLMGKVLVKQDVADARSTVTRRLEFISSDVCVRYICGEARDARVRVRLRNGSIAFFPYLSRNRKIDLART